MNIVPLVASIALTVMQCLKCAYKLEELDSECPRCHGQGMPETVPPWGQWYPIKPPLRHHSTPLPVASTAPPKAVEVVALLVWLVLLLVFGYCLAVF